MPNLYNTVEDRGRLLSLGGNHENKSGMGTPLSSHPVIGKDEPGRNCL
jgi:hypothetical protein